MEQNLPVIAKKVWSLMRVMFFMLKKSINSKTKFLSDLNIIMTRGKIAGKALHNLLFHHHHNWTTATTTLHRRHDDDDDHHLSFPSPSPSDSEFSCTTTPPHPHPHPHPLSPFSTHKKHHQNPPPATVDDGIDDTAAVMKALMVTIAAASPPPVQLGFGKGRSSFVKELRITDSPFPVTDGGEDGGQVDEASEMFITRFYNDLRRQN